MRRIVVAMAFAIVVAACGGDGTATTESNDSTGSTTAAVTTAAPATTTAPASTDAPASEVAAFIDAYGDVGDCLLVEYTPAGDDFDYSVPPQRVDCSQPHDQQIFFVGEVPGAPGDPYPEDALADIVFFDLCLEPFEEQFGVDYDTAASLGVWAAWPFAEEWDAGLRTVKCSVTSPFNPTGGDQLVGDASSAGLVLPGHLVAVGAEFDQGIDIYVYVFGPDGEILDFVNLTADGPDQREASSPVSWSPDLSQIVYAAELPDGNQEIFVVDVATGDKQNISNHPARDVGPTFSPDGTKIAFGSDRDTGGETNLYVMDADGSNVTRVTVHDDRDSSADWSPDGERIVFRRRISGNSDIWTVNADGSGAQFLVGGPAGEYDPDWSPDGSTIAFISDEQGSFDIWTFPAEGITTIGAPPSLEAALATRITDHPGNEEYPEWTPDGEYILFNSDRHGVQDVWMMRADGSDQTALLFTYPVAWPQVVLP
jgi:hypothetical protein